MIIEINIFLSEQLISMFIMGCPGGKINMAAVSAKRSMNGAKKGSAKAGQDMRPCVARDSHFALFTRALRLALPSCSVG